MEAGIVLGVRKSSLAEWDGSANEQALTLVAWLSLELEKNFFKKKRNKG